MVEKIKLANGLTLAMERMPSIRSVSLGIWVRVGSIAEQPDENGLSHMLEHMAFKGTALHTAKDLAVQMDALGGHFNAATSKTYTVYHARVADDNLSEALALLTQLVRYPSLDANELKKEAQVIVEEIGMAEDTPEDVAFDLLAEAMYANQSLSRPILGRADQILAYSDKDVRTFWQKHYQPGNVVISVAGRFDKAQLISMVEEIFGDWELAAETPYPSTMVNHPRQALIRVKPVEQVQICLGYEGQKALHRDRYAMSVFNTIYGGGLSSRLFQSVREDQGLAYTIYSMPNGYHDVGEFIIYAATSPGRVQQVLESVAREGERFLKEGIGDEELSQAKRQMRIGYALSRESPYQRMSSLGGNLLLYGKQATDRQVLRAIEKVSQQDVMRVAQRVFAKAPSIALVGKRVKELEKAIR